uniref:Uncharacterized protein n=1 Tax=Phaeodactylum tricornutum TaxID=2850 RepID=A0A8J9S2J0_PHATR
MCIQALLLATQTRNLAAWVGDKMLRTLLNSVSKSSPVCANRSRSSFKTASALSRQPSSSCATNRLSFKAAACAGVTSRCDTKCRNSVLGLNF